MKGTTTIRKLTAVFWRNGKRERVTICTDARDYDINLMAEIDTWAKNTRIFTAENLSLYIESLEDGIFCMSYEDFKNDGYLMPPPPPYNGGTRKRMTGAQEAECAEWLKKLFEQKKDYLLLHAASDETRRHNLSFHLDRTFRSKFGGTVNYNKKTRRFDYIEFCSGKFGVRVPL